MLSFMTCHSRCCPIHFIVEPRTSTNKLCVFTWEFKATIAGFSAFWRSLVCSSVVSLQPCDLSWVIAMNYNCLHSREIVEANQHVVRHAVLNALLHAAPNPCRGFPQDLAGVYAPVLGRSAADLVAVCQTTKRERTKTPTAQFINAIELSWCWRCCRACKI